MRPIQVVIKQMKFLLSGKKYQRIYTKRTDEIGIFVQQTRDNGFIIVGHFYNDSSSYDTDILLLKTDEYGNEQWNKTFSGSDYENAIEVKQTKDDGYIILGETKSNDPGDTDIWIIKTNSEVNSMTLAFFIDMLPETRGLCEQYLAFLSIIRSDLSLLYPPHTWAKIPLTNSIIRNK